MLCIIHLLVWWMNISIVSEIVYFAYHRFKLPPVRYLRNPTSILFYSDLPKYLISHLMMFSADDAGLLVLIPAPHLGQL